MKDYNIVWCIIDSVRKYHSADDRTRLDFMDEFAKESIEFHNVVTSAPSTVMSISAMMTSLPSYYLGRNYSDFRFDNSYFSTLSSILNRNGWTTRALIMHKDIREKLRVFDLIPRKYWPRGFSHRNWWDNSKINALLKNALRIDGDQKPMPCFWFLDFNCRKDPETSNIVKDSFAALQAAGYTKDNTIFILCSDHGYPDPSRGITPEGLEKQRMTHDIFMTDDNITVPLFISYPGCTEGQKVHTTISTLDLMPTLLDILEIDVDEETKRRWHGRSLRNLIEGHKTDGIQGRKIRTDARFFGQTGRVSALRDDEFKYVHYHDDGAEEFVDVREFSIDEPDISDSADPRVQEKLAEFRDAFQDSEAKGVQFQIDYAVHRLKGQFEKNGVAKSEAPKILVVSTTNRSFSDSLGAALRGVSQSAEIELVSTTEAAATETVFDQVHAPGFQDGAEAALRNLPDVAGKSYDLVLQTYDSSATQKFEDVAKFAALVKAQERATIDLNMAVSVRTGQARRYLRTMYENRHFFKEEPLLIFGEAKKIVVTLARQLLGRFHA